MDFLQKHVNKKHLNKIEILENKFPIHVQLKLYEEVTFGTTKKWPYETG